MPLLPAIQLPLLPLILLHQLLEHLLQPIRVDLQRGEHICNRALHQHAVYEPEAGAGAGKGGKGFGHELVFFDFGFDFADFGGEGLERVLEGGVLRLEVWKGGLEGVEDRGLKSTEGSHLVVSLRRQPEQPWCM
jgi:hypothetical protein